MADKDTISIKEFARREGVSDTLVHFALRDGRLTRASDGRMDPTLVGSQWRASDDARAGLRTSEGGGKGVPYGEALRLKENWLALLRRLEYEEKSRSLVDITTAQNVVFDLFREQRDAWLAWPAKVAPFLAVEFGITDIERLTASLTAHVHNQLADLGEPEIRFEAGTA
ncbi:hypothetical protein [Paraburkholderia sp. 35.1]|uniref:hypothetical protein n=1 Tax=Paraburkholderia sp. 35.1 TaxID=2991058 RepID=UPI003D1B9BF8